MVIDLVVTNTDDGFNSEIPSIHGCESWAHDEDSSISNSIELLRFYINLPNDVEIKIDKARVEREKTIYKLVFEK